MIRVLVVDDETIVGQGIRAILEAAGVTVVATTTVVSHAVTLAASAEPSLIVSDVMFDERPAGLDLPDALRAAGLGHIPVLFLSSWDVPYYVRRARDAGAAGYLPKDASLPALVRAIESAAAGQTTFPIRGIAGEPPSERDLRFMELLAAGRTSEQMAGVMGLSPRTVEGIIMRLARHHGAVSRTQLVALAIRNGWIPLDAAVGPRRAE
ncbi:MAG: response regulator transcription factor [Chloroflexi bacterium]|nr:response regulator transcription factor [Chloroflexota bacterium]